MFKREQEQSMAHVSDNETIIAQGVKVEGDFTSQGSVSIEGEVVGTVATEQSLRVGEAAKIHADVTAANAVVAGEIRGNLRVGERLELTETARVHGDIECQVFSVAPGAMVNGRVTMAGGQSEETSE